jgi:hypothetical protein
LRQESSLRAKNSQVSRTESSVSLCLCGEFLPFPVRRNDLPPPPLVESLHPSPFRGILGAMSDPPKLLDRMRTLERRHHVGEQVIKRRCGCGVGRSDEGGRSAHAAALVCDASPGVGARHPDGAGAAGPFGREDDDDDDLHRFRVLSGSGIRRPLEAPKLPADSPSRGDA